MRSPSSAFGRGAPLTPAPFSPVPSTDGVAVAVWALAGPDPSLPGARPSANNGRPIVLCHATGFHAGVWSPIARRLAGFRAFAPDLRGHGDTPAPTGRDMDWNGFADDVLAVVDAMTEAGVDTDSLVAAGHSKGGAALLLAEERRPGTFGALYCYEPVVLPADSGLAQGEKNPLAEGALRRRDTFESREAAYANYAGKLPFSALDPEALEAYVAHGFVDQPDGTVRLSCRPEIESAVYRMGGAHDAFAHLGEITCPVTIATGAVDTFGPAAFAARIAEGIPDGHLVEYPDLGHFGPLEDPARIASGIAEALTA